MGLADHLYDTSRAYERYWGLVGGLGVGRSDSHRRLRYSIPPANVAEQDADRERYGVAGHKPRLCDRGEPSSPYSGRESLCGRSQ